MKTFSFYEVETGDRIDVELRKIIEQVHETKVPVYFSWNDFAVMVTENSNLESILVGACKRICRVEAEASIQGVRDAHYHKLSPEESMELYSEKHQTFLTEWERPLERKLDKMIRDRIKQIAGEDKEGTGNYYSVILPFELPFPDGDTGEIKYWRFLDIEHGGCTLLASRIDEHEDTVFCNVPYELDTLYALYRNLKRMGFWDEEWRHSFELE